MPIATVSGGCHAADAFRDPDVAVGGREADVNVRSGSFGREAEAPREGGDASASHGSGGRRLVRAGWQEQP
jgi:hypothetical protein